MNSMKWTVLALLAPTLLALGCSGNSGGGSNSDLNSLLNPDSGPTDDDKKHDESKDDDAGKQTKLSDDDTEIRDPSDDPVTSDDENDQGNDQENDDENDQESDEEPASAPDPLKPTPDIVLPDPSPSSTVPTDPAPDGPALPTDPEIDPTPATPELSTRELIDQTVFRIEATGSFATPLSSENLSVSGGTGFVIDAEGYALTNAHVVSGATLLSVQFPGEDRERNAQVVARAECSDLALMKIGGEAPFTHLDWSERAAELGTDVIAIGYPLGGDLTLTTGIVSKESTPAHTSWASIDDVLEHTAIINPGNSGGPLLDSDYAIMGVNFAANDYNQYYAIGELEARSLVEQLRSGEDVHSIGLTGTAVAADTVSGIWVYAVQAGSPADSAGIKPGDLITHFGNLPLAPDSGGNMNMADYCDILRSHSEGSAILVRVIRWSTGATWEGQINGRKLSLVEGSEPAPTPTPTPAPDPLATRDVANVGGSIALSVPARWDEDQSYNVARFDSSPGHGLVVSADVDSFAERYDVAGVALVAWGDTSVTADELLDAMSFASACDTTTERETLSAAQYSGVYEIYSGCPGDPAVITQVVLEHDDHLLVILHQAVTSADVNSLELVLSSFVIDSSELP